MFSRTAFLIRSPGPVWDGIKQSVSSSSAVVVTGSAMTTAEAWEQVRMLRPDIVISGLDIEGNSAIPLLMNIRDMLPNCIIIVFAGRCIEEELRALIPVRASSYLLWDDLNDPAFAGAQVAILSGTFIVTSRRPAQALLGSLTTSRSSTQALLLTEREQSVISLIAAGMSDKEIAMQLNVQATTVGTYVARAGAKLHARNRAHLVAVAVRCGLVPD